MNVADCVAGFHWSSFIRGGVIISAWAIASRSCVQFRISKSTDFSPQSFKAVQSIITSSSAQPHTGWESGPG